MIQQFTHASVQSLCELFGKSRQAWYKSNKVTTQQQELNAIILDFVKDQRVAQPRIGTTKLQFLFNKKFEPEGFFVGRDTLYNLLRTNRMLVKVRRKYRPPRTNGNGESIYPDLRKKLIVSDINQLWCCDITYFYLRSLSRHCYATFVTDEKSHLIVGYYVSLSMTAEETLKALEIAVTLYGPPNGKFDNKLIFHTDRGSQFKSILFRNFHQAHEIKISMTEEGKSSENPVSERLNGILKNEMMMTDSFEDLKEACHIIDKTVTIFNEQRPHLSCGMLTPSEAHTPGLGILKKLWKQRKKRNYVNTHS